MVTNVAPEDYNPTLVRGLRERFQESQLPIMQDFVGSDAGSYSNEGDAYERDFITAFYGQENYYKLSAIKGRYDPTDLFIVASGVGSERWDQQGLCRV
jgi:hypothetical protein